MRSFLGDFVGIHNRGLDDGGDLVIRYRSFHALGKVFRSLIQVGCLYEDVDRFLVLCARFFVERDEVDLGLVEVIAEMLLRFTADTENAPDV